MTSLVTLGDEALTLVLSIRETGMPEIVAFAAAAAGAELAAGRAPRVNGLNAAEPGAVLLPTGGLGYFGWPAIAGHRDGRDSVFEFGRWRVEGGVNDCVLSAEDEDARVALEIRLSIVDGVLTSATTFTNNAQGVFTLDRCAAGTMAYSEIDATLTSLTGMWGREFQTTC